MKNMEESILQVNSVSKSFFVISSKIKIRVLDKVSFQSFPGLILLKGINGSGKSTLLRLICGLLKPSSGKIIKKRNLNIGYLPQNPQFHKGVSGLDFLQFLSKINGSPTNSKQNAIQWLNNFGIPDKFKELPIDLYSEGMKRRLGLAIAFSNKPDLILLDEPLENLDSDARTITLSFIEKELSNAKTIIVATHDDVSFRKFNPKLIVLENGKFIKSGGSN